MISINRKAVRAAGGTQSDELQAKIKSVTSSTTVGAVFVYDTRNDSDSGAWRKKARGSWYYEDLNTATRGGRREFPSIALIVSDTDGTGTVTIYDLDDPAMPMWMVIPRDNVTSIAMLNAHLVLGQSSNAIDEINFAADTYNYRFTDALKIAYLDISNRGGTFIGSSLGGGGIANSAVNDVAVTVAQGAEIGALGLPIPTIAVATNGGVSVIHPNGDVYDLKDSTATNRSYSDVKFRESGDIFAWSSMNGTAHSWYANQLYSNLSAASDLFKYDEGDNANLPNLLADSTQTIEVGKGSVFTGGDNGLSIVKENLANPVEGASAHITSSYNTGYMLGDIRFAGLANAASADRSVKGNTLNHNGSVSNADVATGAELQAYSGFSASNYLSRASDTDFDFGTGDFSISLWVKNTNWTGTQRLLGRSQDSNTKRLSIYSSGTTLYAYIKDTATKSASADVLQNDVWQHVFAFRRGSVLYLYVDGKEVASVTGADSINITPASNGMLVIGSETFDNGSTILSTALVNGSLSLVRISATAPTPQQVKDIYEAEKPLFRAGAKCLLQGDNSAVQGLAYDKTTGLLQATQTAGTTKASATIFRGLEVADTFLGNAHDSNWTYNSATLLAANGGVSAYYRSGGSLLCDLPAIDVRGDINTADTKLPDDGKLHFSGVTTSNGGDVLGHIPIGENENVTVKAHVTAKGYGSNLGTHYANYVLTEQFYRAAGGDVTSAVAEASIVSQESAAGLDATIGGDGQTGRTIKITVTGDASDRIVWTASVEVIRDAEKSYER